MKQLILKERMSLRVVDQEQVHRVPYHTLRHENRTGLPFNVECKGDGCVMCSHVDGLIAAQKGSEAFHLRAKVRYQVRVIDLNDVSSGVQMLCFGRSLIEAVTDALEGSNEREYRPLEIRSSDFAHGFRSYRDSFAGDVIRTAIKMKFKPTDEYKLPFYITPYDADAILRHLLKGLT
ncbi:hypothetical protein VPFG_00225 [Vibrio phage nt-1]|uniref:Uncharacterized protein n=1 Tax=Vibrio phage nt-1 TaxID=115992 RepID=R9TIL6_9CAUD|nr:hypothetical protein VPFG_00225 [Vibrio phage nt-1]AGN30225.2 hypothetical protein VPFG_00225 [Vibrio phage nt-1]